MRKLNIFLLAAIVISIGAMTSCSKSNSGPAKFTDSVFYSPWMPLNMTFQGVDQSTGDSAWEQTVSASKVTTAIVDKGVVLTYVLQEITNNGDSVISNADGILSPFISVGSIDLFYEGNDVNGVPFRYVIIPGNVLTTNNWTAKQLKSLNYTEATKLLGNMTARQSATPGVQ